MALNGQTLGTQIANLVIDPQCPPDLRVTITKQWQDIATVIVTHIQTMGQVQTTVTGSGTGANSAGPVATVVTGTGVGKIL